MLHNSKVVDKSNINFHYDLYYIQMCKTMPPSLRRLVHVGVLSMYVNDFIGGMDVMVVQSLTEQLDLYSTFPPNSGFAHSTD
jgi:hypothetical protein